VTNNVQAALTGFVTGTPPFTYQWIKDGLIVTNRNFFISGAQSPSLAISVAGSTMGNYALVASNAFGCVTSSWAMVSQAAPWLASQPVSITTNAGSTVSFPVTALGQSPLYFQWYIGTQPLTNGANISGATNSSLTLSNVTTAASGDYSLVVTNSTGTVSNVVATLTVVDLFSPPTIISGSTGLDRASNGFAFDLSALIGQNIVIETSTNLTDWQPIFTNGIDSSPFHYHDPGAITNRNGFYRVRLQ
jgi:hypothetical protein